MSNSLSPKRLPQINQETLERVLEKLRQPFSIAVLGSLVAHGVLAAALPSLLADKPDELDTQRRVQVVELSPAEQRQLPSLDAATPLPPSLLTTKPLQPNQPAPKLPDPKVYNDPSLYTFPLSPPPNFPPPTFTFPVPPSIFDVPAPSAKRSPTPPAPKPLAPKPPPDLAPPLESKPLAESKPADTDAKDSDKPVPTPSAPVRAEKLSPEQIAALQKDAERSRQPPLSYTFDGPETAEKALELAQANATVFVAAAEKLSGGDYDSKGYQKPEKISRALPEEACPFIKTARTATVGAIVKPDGQLAEAPALLLTSGFKGLDTLALEAVSQNKFATNDRHQIVRLEITFDPSSVCQADSKPS